MVIFKRISQGDAEVKIVHAVVMALPFIPLQVVPCFQNFVALALWPLWFMTLEVPMPSKKSGCLSSMQRVGGINFNSRVSGGYRPRAASVVLITEEKLILAIKEGFQFFENHYSSLVFGV